eukprot:TRINITY_DN19894_c0_g1_i1.p2 TRINITY_DN19894_c0_g1~~TRINITY_DN19894_c0_g1_i1.p2  ORF type:complete len:282 (+),score=58.65 TRINITY_DN19894_c0_g1_i1:499-1344(+)
MAAAAPAASAAAAPAARAPASSTFGSLSALTLSSTSRQPSSTLPFASPTRTTRVLSTWRKSNPSSRSMRPWMSRRGSCCRVPPPPWCGCLAGWLPGALLQGVLRGWRRLFAPHLSAGHPHPRLAPAARHVGGNAGGGVPAAEVFEPASASLAADAALTASSSPKVRMEFSHLFAVAVSGALARTAVAPLDRLKILRQVTPPSSSPRWLRRQAAAAASAAGSGSAPASAASAARPAGTWVGLKGVVDMVRRDGGGVRSLFRGNGANVIRIVPATAVQLAGVD